MLLHLFCHPSSFFIHYHNLVGGKEYVASNRDSGIHTMNMNIQGGKEECIGYNCIALSIFGKESVLATHILSISQHVRQK